MLTRLAALQTRSPASASAPSSVLELASQVFASNRIEVNPKYSEKLARYNAMVKRVNMSDTQHAAQTINQWVSTATRGLVPSIIQEGQYAAQRVYAASIRSEYTQPTSVQNHYMSSL